MSKGGLLPIVVMLLVANFAIGSVWQLFARSRMGLTAVTWSAMEATSLVAQSANRPAQDLPLEGDQLPADDDSNAPAGSVPEELSDTSLDELLCHLGRTPGFMDLACGLFRPIEPSLSYSLFACSDLLRPPRA
jgi:hypothetical protein